jgi:hypothetical protein
MRKHFEFASLYKQTRICNSQKLTFLRLLALVTINQLQIHVRASVGGYEFCT